MKVRFPDLFRKLICVLLAVAMAAGLLPAAVFADGAYDAYLLELEEYNAKKAAYEAYLSELAYYNAQNAAWDDYDAKLAAYESYLKYLSDLEEYNAAVEHYNDALAAYEAYRNYLKEAEKCEAKLTVIEAVVNGNMYETLMGETVQDVLANYESTITGYTTVDPALVTASGIATSELRALLTAYLEQTDAHDKFCFYKEHYASLTSNFETLFEKLRTLYDYEVVKFKLKQEDKDHRYCEFLCQLYTIGLCLNDQKTVNKKWRIQSAKGFLSYTELGGYEGLEDTNLASPGNLNFPDEVPQAEYPETPVMPDQVAEVLEPIAPGGKRPTLPSPVAAPGDPPSPPVYTITWKNEDGTTLKTDTLAHGAMPVYTGATPEKAATAQYSYTFSGWSPAVGTVDGDAVYTAQYSSTVNPYTVTWKNEDGTTLKTDTLAYGEIPAYSGETPTKAATAQSTYAFSGWSPSVSAVSGNITYTAQFTEAVNQYTVTWKNHDGTVLKTDTVAYGETPVYSGATPTKAATAQYNYVFSNWSPAISTVKGNVTYTAQFTEAVNQYTVTWKNENGATLKTDVLAYGEMPTYTGSTPTKAATAQYSYTFSNWSPAITTVKGNITYTAQFTEAVNQYTVTWKNENGATLKTDVLAYGAMPVYSGATPTKAATAQYSYTFSNWSPAITTVKGNITYTAQYSNTVNQYTVTWKNHDGTVLKTDTVAYGETPVYSGATPTKPATAQYSYTFSNWSPAITTVKGNITYTAQFTEAVNQYTVTWKNENGTILKTDVLAYGEMPTYTGSTPTKAATAQYSYTFSNWSPAITTVKGNITYTAQFTEAVNQYTVTWKNENGTTLKTDVLAYGEMPTYTGSTPTKAATAQYSYTFSNWSPAISTVKENITYTAQYSSSVNQYTVTWKNHDGTTLKTDTLAYGATPAYSGSTPAKAATAQYSYTFSNWSPAITTVKGNITYTAQFTEAVNQYTVTWKNENGATLKTDVLAYGAMPVYSGATPTKAATAQYSYTFSNWSPAISTVKENITYTAQYSSSVNQYTVTWKNHDGTTLKTDTLAYGAMPVYSGTTPTKPGTAQNSYMFDRWSPAVSEVTGNVTYTATYTASTNQYTVTWNNFDGTLLEKDTGVHFGEMPSYNGSTPQKPGNAQYSYAFSGWSPSVSEVSGNATYTAKFSETVNQYTVTWKNDDGTTLKTDVLAYGATPVYSGSTPAKAATAQYNYTFSGWSTAVTTVQENVTYTAQFTETVNQYTVTWKNEDGTILKTDVLAYGAMPVYSGATPTKPGTAQNSYLFGGWSPAVSEVTGNATYTATYTASTNQYTVIWKNHDGTTLKTETLAYGAMPVYSGTTPAKAATAQYSYTFSGWSPTVSTVKENITYTAQFTEAVNQYSVTWKNHDGTILKAETLAYGATPVYSGSTPAKAATAQYSYTFSGWSPTVSTVKENITYTAQYAENLNEYTVVWKNEDGTILKTDVLAYGTMPIYSGATPAKTATAQDTYSFSGWSPAVAPVKENITYTAQYGSTVNSYTVTWKNNDGTVLKTDVLSYGEMPAYTGEIPAKTATEQHSYAFSGWSPTVETVSGNATYTAQFTEAVNQYTVIWKNHDGAILRTETVAYGEVPAYTGATPEKAATAQYSYTFSGWSPAVAAVGGDAIYTAQFAENVNKYTVTWKNDGGTVLKTETWTYGEMPVYTGSTPEKAATAQYTYVFSDWSPALAPVSGNVTYTALYERTVNSYTVTWKNYDGTVLKTETVRYGTTPAYDGETPQKAATAQYGYRFTGWSPKTTQVRENVTYTAQFAEYLNSYAVVWKDGETVLQTDTLNYGDTPVYRGNTEKEATKEKTFVFLGWSPAPAPVTGDAVYTATYREDTVHYSVTWQIGGRVLHESLYEYLQMPRAPQDPEQYLEAEERAFATFAGWNREVVPVTENAVYKAVFSAAIFDLPQEDRENVLLIPSAGGYTVATGREDLPIGLHDLAKTAVGNGKDLIIEYPSGVQIFFPNKLAGEIAERNLHVSLQTDGAEQPVRMFAKSTSEHEKLFAGRVCLTDGEGNVVTMTGWQLRVPVESGDMAGLSGYSLDDGEQGYKLAQSGNYAVFVSDGSAAFKLVRKLSIRVEVNGGGNVSFGDAETNAGNLIKADIRAAIGYEVESVELYYEIDGEKVAVAFDTENQTFVMPPYNVVFAVQFRKLVFVVNFYVDGSLYHTATYGYGEDLVLPEDPAKDGDAEKVYTFSGWTPDVGQKVFASAEYHAKFNVSTVADENYGKAERAFNFPYKLVIVAVVFLAAAGVSTFFAVKFIRKKKKKKAEKTE